MRNQRSGASEGAAGAPLPRVLVVAENAQTLANLGKLLSAVPADGVPTASFEAARYAARTLGRFDVVIADAELSEGNALELAAELKRAHGCATLMLSGQDAPTTEAGDITLPEGIDLWIIKPPTLASLRKAIRKLVRA